MIVAEQLSGLYGAVKMLYTRVRLILDYLKAVQTGLCVNSLLVIETGFVAR